MKYENVINILFDNTGSLSALARMSGVPEFRFYNGASLIGLDLRNQDLTGLNFDDADLRGSSLDNVNFDPGAFNGAKLSQESEYLKDPFEFYVHDIAEISSSGLYFFVRFRELSLESAIESLDVTYKELSQSAPINLTTLRNARRGKVVSCSTAFQICKELNKRWEDQKGRSDGQQRLFDNEDHHTKSRSQQPFIELLSLRTEGGFDSVSRKRLFALFEERVWFGDDLLNVASGAADPTYQDSFSGYQKTRSIFF